MNGAAIGTVVLSLCAGVAATFTMDLLGSASRRLGLTAGAKGSWVGRWYLGIPRGRFAHRDIAAAPERAGEERAALVGHYLIGVVLTVFYIFVARRLGVPPGSLVAALGYGLATCVFPWFLVYPALGFGPFGVTGRPELKLFTSSVANHLFYGLGLWWSANLFGLAS
jgi:hypothetical protein